MNPHTNDNPNQLTRLTTLIERHLGHPVEVTPGIWVTPTRVTDPTSGEIKYQLVRCARPVEPRA